MGLLRQLTPLNVIEEKEKFFADFSYNPQFLYEEETPAQDLLKYGLPNPELLEKAQEIVNRAYNGNTETDLVKENGPIITQQKVTDMVTAFLKAHDLDRRINISWSSSYIARATMSSDTIKLKTTAEFRHYDTLGMIYHELGTHALRRVNYEQQPWYRKKKKNGFGPYLKTEEGLASIHSLLPKKIKSSYATAIRYLAVDVAQNHSFSEVWDFLTPYIDSEEKRWIATLRQKRGLTDTSQPGGFTKDLVYFEGMNEVLRWLEHNDDDPTVLYLGKFSHTDIELAKQLSNKASIIIPHFVKQKEAYTQNIQKIRNEMLF